MTSIDGKDVKRVVVACEAGMGSSVLLTSQLKRQLSPYGVTVGHSPVTASPTTTQTSCCAIRVCSPVPGRPRPTPW